MHSFKTFLVEASKIGQFGKLTHLTHLEDAMIEHGKPGLHHAMGTLNAIHDKFQGHFNPTKVTTKYDGSSTVVFGHHPKTGKFFVGTKSAFSKNPKLSYTPEDVEKHHGSIPQLAHNLKNALEHMAKVTPKHGVYQGDIMHGGLGHNVHEHNGMYHFTPNTIMYSVPKKSEEGKKIEHAKFGIAVHTKYHGNDFETMHAGFEPDTNNFKKHPHVHMLPIDVNTDFHTGKEALKFKFHSKQMERAASHAPPDTFEVTASHKSRLMQYVNHKVREGGKGTSEDYMKHLLSKDVETSAKKTNAMERAHYVLSHKKHFDALFNLHHHVQASKHAIIDHLNNNLEYEHSINGKESKPEGYVAIHDGHPTKLVNRGEFSRQNFAKHIKEEYLLSEGGNITIGDVKAKAIQVSKENRHEVQSRVHETLSAIHNTFAMEHGHSLFGQNAKALHNRTAYSGSTHSLMSPKISHEEFAKHKSSVGDIDVQIPKEHAEKLHSHMRVGRAFGNYTVVGNKKHGTETSTLMKHEPTGHVHQFDFEHSSYHNHEPTSGEQLAHHSDWNDIKSGIKGFHHKLLIHTAGGEKHKYSGTHGLRSKTNPAKMGYRSPEEVTHHLFGKDAKHSDIHSFSGVTKLIKHHIDKSEHQGIYDRFKKGATSKTGIDHRHALKHLRDHLNVKDT